MNSKLLIVPLLAATTILTAVPPQAAPSYNPSMGIPLTAHAQKFEWESSEVGQVGTTGRALHLEALRADDAGINLRGRVQSLGWLDGSTITTGTAGRALRLGSIRVWKEEGTVSVDDTIDKTTALIICDSQCDGDSWGERGARANGYTTILERMCGGGGYAAIAPGLGASVTDGLASGMVPLPDNAPGLIMLTLGGNDATAGRTDAEIQASMRAMLDTIRVDYPRSKVVVNGVMSRNDPDHVRRRQVDGIVMREAGGQGIAHISVAGWGTTYDAQYRDGVHLTQTGHDTIAAPYTAALMGALR